MADRDLTQRTPRRKLIAHLREQIAQDPEGYANARKLEAVADRLVDGPLSARFVVELDLDHGLVTHQVTGVDRAVSLVRETLTDYPTARVTIDREG